LLNAHFIDIIIIPTGKNVGGRSEIMLDIKQAVKNALDYVTDIIPNSGLIDPRLEEVESSTDGRTWYITVSFIRQIPPKSVAEKIAELANHFNPSDREYKLIAIDAETGKPLSMKIRQLV
jgi:hypothetical protein